MPQNKYLSAKRLILAEDVKTLSELLPHIRSKTRLARDISTTPERFDRLLANPVNFRMDDIYNIAEQFDIDFKLVINLVHGEHLAKLEEAKQKKKKK
jgi:hypothetical protein